MNKKSFSRPFHGHGSFEEEFEFEEVAMDDEPRKNGKRRDERENALKSVSVDEDWTDAEAMDEQEIDAMVAEISSAQPKMKKSRGRHRKEQHIASNPSVNPTRTRTSLIDGVKVANTRLRVSLEDEMKSHGIKKLPKGVSAADLAIPSYDSVVTATERRPLDCALYHEYAEGELSPLEQMMRKSAERSEKNKKKEQKEQKEQKAQKDSKPEKKAGKNQESKPEKVKKDCKTCDGFHGCKGCRKAEKYAEAKAAEKAEKVEKPAEKQVEKHEKHHEKKQREKQPVPVQPTAVTPVTQVQPAFYQTQVPGIDPIRAELLKQQEMLLQMIHQCHQTLASIQAQLLSPVISQPVAVPVAVPVQPIPAPIQPTQIQPIPIPASVQSVPVQASVLENAPSDSVQPVTEVVSETVPTAEEVQSVVEAEAKSGTEQENGKSERKSSRRERQRMKKQAETPESAEPEAVGVVEEAEVKDEIRVSEEKKPGKPEKKAGRKSEKKPEIEEEKPCREKHAKPSRDRETSISDVISAHPEDFVGPEDFDEEFDSGAADLKKKVPVTAFSVEEDEETLKIPAKKPKTEREPKVEREPKPEKAQKAEKSPKPEKVLKALKAEKGEKPEKPEKSAKGAKKEERLRQLQNSEFSKMGLSREILLALDDAQYETPSRIQQEFIPKALTGEDLMGQAQTGTGKTAAFAIPILQLVKFDENSYDPQALILVPTRELAVQVKDEIEKLAKYTDLECIALYGGKPLPPQVQALREGVDVVIGTPGRVMDHISRRSLTLRNLKIAVLDEADRMLDIGFRPDIEKILRQAPQSRQTLLLSATIPPPVESIARKYMREPEILDCSHKDISSETIEQFYFTVDPELKYDLLLKLLDRESPKQAIIFCRTKRGVEKIANRLGRDVQSVGAIHGDLQQKQRDRVMASFRAGKTRYLVATDVIGRGIDVSGISHIINYDIPKFCDDYVHRVGRTGRMGHEGVAFTFVAPEEGNELTRIEMRINQLLKRDEIEGFSGLPKMTAVPVEESSVNEEAKTAPVRRKRRL